MKAQPILKPGALYTIKTGGVDHEIDHMLMFKWNHRLNCIETVLTRLRYNRTKIPNGAVVMYVGKFVPPAAAWDYAQRPQAALDWDWCYKVLYKDPGVVLVDGERITWTEVAQQKETDKAWL